MPELRRINKMSFRYLLDHEKKSALNKNVELELAKTAGVNLVFNLNCGNGIVAHYEIPNQGAIIYYKAGKGEDIIMRDEKADSKIKLKAVIDLIGFDEQSETYQNLRNELDKRLEAYIVRP